MSSLDAAFGDAFSGMAFSVGGTLSPDEERAMEAKWQAYCERVLAGVAVPFGYEDENE